MANVQWCLLNIGTLSQNRLWGETARRRQPYCTMTLIHADGRNILVDPTRTPSEMARYLDDACGLTPAKVDVVFLTHFHADHRRGLEAFPDALWLMNEDEIACCWEHTADGSPDQAVLERLESAPERIADGVEQLPTPGHTPHHTSLLLHAGRRRVVVAGDALMTRAHYVACQAYAEHERHDLALRSMERVVESADIVIPGHDNYFAIADLRE